MRDTDSPARVAILALPETSASVIYGMYDMFMSAGRDWGLIVDGSPGAALIHPQVASLHKGALICGNGVRIVPQASLDECLGVDVVCVPELLVPPGESLDGRFIEEMAWLRRCYEGGAMLATACSGAMLLAQAGLLDGHEATTHWAYCDVMARRYPQIKVRGQRALVASGEGQRLIMAGGGTSWLDLALYLIARLIDVDAAMQVARLNLIDWHDIGQQPFARLARSRQVDDAVIARCQSWIAEHYAQPSPVAAMSQLSGLAERSFKRRFQQATGMPPLEYVHTMRLEEAKQMLESGNQPIEAIANEVGYEDAGFFSRLFRRNVGMTPAQYRKRFGAMRKALATL
ncbi:MAG TPA: helix-turn-helix domain-containing protein [Pseudomonas sp.]|uniref:GlxA family transcriptional regulator n=1 Tax=Pseudomonas sp. TaxID=306 RepID=UPI002B73CFE6|nr:helix-turn-helix domain-containing protein [Pseudomonas sp.]HSX87084.1 helix-turn-helix domain-containing protein [Pseudomonas sp.]